MAAIELRCLGLPQCLADSAEPVRFRTRKHLALLIRLAVEPGKSFTRDYLIDLLWPAAVPARGAHSLAQAVSVVRACVGREHVLVRRAGVGLAPGAVAVDVLRLDGEDVRIGGGFLDGFEVPGARPFEDWKDEWRAKLLPRLRDCLVRQMDASRRRGDFATVERHAEVLAELDPVSEDAVRGLIEARAWVGDRTTALRVYAAYAARLAEALGAKPSADLTRMAELLREGRRRPVPRAVGEPVVRAETRLEPEPLIGREPEFTALYDAWLGARRGAPQVVVILGDPGLGKTTLANAFVSTCQLEGAVVARAQAYEAERELPFAVLAELVRQLTLQRAIGGADPEALSELSRVAPEISGAFPGVPRPVEWAPDVMPLRLADALLRTVTAAADESPVVLVVDDIHAADNASVAILHAVARKLPPGRLLMILAARSSELRVAGAPAALTSDAQIEGLRVLELEPLSAQASAALVDRAAHAAGSPDGDVPRQRILAAGRGNPLALSLLTREWAAHGPESLLRDLEAVNTQPVAAPGIPRAIKAVFDRQVGRLPPRTRAVLDLAAVLGRRLADLALYQAVDCTPGEAAAGLSRLRDEGLVREIQGGLEFRNELIRAQAYYAVPGPVRQHLHRQVGGLLEAHSSHGVRGMSVETAWHFLRGHDPEKASSHALAGADGSRHNGAPYESQQLIQALMDQHPASARSNPARLALARALMDQSKALDAGPLLDSVLGDSNASQSARAEASVLKAGVEYLLNRGTDRLRESATRALASARSCGNRDLVVRSLFEYARAGVESGNRVMVEDAKKEMQCVLANESENLHPRAWVTLAYCHSFFCDARNSRDALLQALRRLGADAADVPLLSLCYSGLGIARVGLCESEAALRDLRLALQYAQEIGDDSRASILTANIAAVCSMRGQYEEAINEGLLSIQLGQQAPNQPFLVSSYTNLIDPYLATGQPAKAAEALQLATRWIEEEPRSWFARATLLGESAGLALMLGDQAQALEHIAAMETEARGREDGAPFPGYFQRLRVFKAALVDGRDQAYRVLARGSETFGATNPFHYLDMVVAKSWLEVQFTGTSSATTVRELESYTERGVNGRLAVMRMQGFL